MPDASAAAISEALVSSRPLLREEIVTGLGMTLGVAAGVFALRRLTERWRVLDIPNERSSHSTPTPRGGGLAIVLASLGGVVLTLTLRNAWTSAWTSLVVAALLVTIVSAIDDFRSLSTKVRMAAHIAGALLVLAGASQVMSIGGTNFSAYGVAAVVTFVWITGLTNAYNFMDGIDGIAGLQGVVAGVTWVILAHDDPDPTPSRFALFLAASSAGFLIHNWSPAKIFMGDVGSAFLGFAFAALPLTTAEPHLIVAALVVWPFVFDSAFTFLRRLRQGEDVFSAHRSHLYQRLVVAGKSHRAVTLLYGSLSIAGSGLAVWTNRSGRGTELVSVGIVAGMAVALVAYVARVERRIAR